ncbi:MAG: ArsA family ATPase [Candidatus Nanopelagicales bacterium]
MIENLLRDLKTEVIIVCVTGGVGKTTLSATLALRSAELGRKVCLITIDPAERLADAMGIGELTNTPKRVDTIGNLGSLDALMLDAKSTFDDLIISTLGIESATKVLANNFYRNISSSLAGTQEYMAMEKLAQLREAGTWDLIVVDTPPSRSALDFLSAPERMNRFLGSRLLRALITPVNPMTRIFNVGVNAIIGLLSKILSSSVLSELKDFVILAAGVFDSFQERSKKTYDAIANDRTAFVVVTTAQTDAMAEAAFFTEQIEKDGLRLSHFLINRISRADMPIHNISNQALLSAYLAEHRKYLAQIERIRSFTLHHRADVVLISEALTDVQDIESLRVLARQLSPNWA